VHVNKVASDSGSASYHHLTGRGSSLHWNTSTFRHTWHYSEQSACCELCFQLIDGTSVLYKVNLCIKITCKLPLLIMLVAVMWIFGDSS
jgi:hypothetical protein